MGCRGGVAGKSRGSRVLNIAYKYILYIREIGSVCAAPSREYSTKSIARASGSSTWLSSSARDGCKRERELVKSSIKFINVDHSFGFI